MWRHLRPEIATVTFGRSALVDASKPEIKGDITDLDRSGKAAVVRVALFRDGKQIFTDYISLYRFEDGWKMVAKTFNRH